MNNNLIRAKQAFDANIIDAQTFEKICEYVMDEVLDA